GKQWDTLAILRVPDRDGQCTPACDSPRMGSHLLISRASFLVAIICLLSLFLSREPAALAQQTGVPTRVLPRSGPVRMAYYYPPDSASLDSLRANIRRLDIVATYWLEIDESGQVRSSETREAQTGWAGAYDYAAIASAADLYLVMSYGFRTSGSDAPGSTAPLSWVDATLAFAVGQLPADRVLLGIPFYGYDWNVTRGPPA